MCACRLFLMFSNGQKMIKIDRNMSELWTTVCKKYIILTLVYLLVYCANSLLKHGHEKLQDGNIYIYISVLM